MPDRPGCKKMTTKLAPLSDKLVSRPFLIIGGGIMGLTAVFFLWSIFGKLKSEVEGVGVVIKGDRMVTIHSQQQGIVAKQFYELNQQVRKGRSVLALDVSQQKLQQRAAQQQVEIGAALSKRAEVAASKIEKAAFSSLVQAKQELVQNQATLNQLIDQQVKVYDKVKLLFEDRRASANELASAYGTLSQLQQQLVGYQQNLTSQNINYNQIIQSNAQNNLQLADNQISNLAGLKQLDLQVQQSLEIKSPINGLVASYNSTIGDFVNPGDPVMTLMPTEGPLRAILLVGAQGFQRIKKGDQVLLSPGSTPAIRFGYVKAKVTDLAESPATQDELLKAFGSIDLAQILLQGFEQQGSQNIPYLVRVTIETTSAGQPAWTLGKQPPWGLRPGSSTSARIIAEEVSPISLVLPFLRGL